MTKFYLAARYSRHAEMRGYADQLEALGHTVTSRWINGEHQASDGELLDPGNADHARKLMQEDLEDIFEADTFVAFTEAQREPTRGGRHVEFGLALWACKRIFLVGPVENLFYLYPGITQFAKFDDFMDVLKGEK